LLVTGQWDIYEVRWVQSDRLPNSSDQDYATNHEASVIITGSCGGKHQSNPFASKASGRQSEWILIEKTRRLKLCGRA